MSINPQLLYLEISRSLQQRVLHVGELQSGREQCPMGKSKGLIRRPNVPEKATMEQMDAPEQRPWKMRRHGTLNSFQ
jgi:hypothetical protein